MTKILLLILVFIPNLCFALDTPTITATAKGPNQINLTWSAVTNPGWGYKVEIQSDGDSRYSTYTDLTALLKNGQGYIPYWVTESHYIDPGDDGSACQFPVFSLKHNTLYNFRVRSYGKTDVGVATYSSYSTTASETTTTPTTIRHVKAGVSGGNGESEETAWDNISDAASLEAGSPNGTLIIIHTGNYASDRISPSNSGVSKIRRIWYVVDPGDTATITSESTQNFINLGGNDYIVVDGLAITDSNGTDSPVIFIESGGTRNVIANTTLTGPGVVAGSGYSPWIQGPYNFLHNNYWKGYGTSDGNSGSTLAFVGEGSSHNIAQYCKLEDGGHDTTICNVGANHNALLNILSIPYYGMGFEVVGSGSDYNLFEGWVITYTGNGGLDDKPAFELSTGYNTVRRCIAYSSSVSGHGAEFSTLGGGTSQYNLVYNNVFYQINGGAVWFMATANTNQNIVNNIIYNCAGDATGSGYTNPVDILVRGTYTGSKVHNNLIQAATGASATNINIGSSEDKETVAEANVDKSTYFYDNKTTAPTFLDSANGDFHLQSTSYGLALSEAVTDAVWGSVVGAGESLGAFKYYEISGGSSTPKVQGITAAKINGVTPYRVNGAR